MCSKIQSSFHGKIEEIPGIAVDNFEDQNLKSRAYFLSHCHSDHTRGLFSAQLINALKRGGIFIYMSELSAAIVADDCKDNSFLMDCIRPLNLGTTHITLPKLFNYDEEHLRVTLIPAGHCLGSVMFLFETLTNKILYTGDFNISINDISNYALLHDENQEPLNIDIMYIDTTFIGLEYEYFPKRSDVISSLLKEIKDWLDLGKENKIALSVSAKYGYEYVYDEIYKKLGLKVYVNDERWTFYSTHPSLTNGVTNKEEESRMHICRDINEKCYHKRCSLTNPLASKYLFIRFSAMKWNGYELEQSGLNRLSKDRIDACFATHCSRTEILGFVNYFSPKKVVGFPNKYLGSTEECLFESLSKSGMFKRKIELSLKKETTAKKDRKMDKQVLKKIFEI